MSDKVRWLTMAVALFALGVPCTGGAAPPAVEAEETVYTYEPADNGAGPLWCYGSTCLVRVGRETFASGIETIKGAKPLNNVRWMLFQRTPGGWRRVQLDEKGRTREPCPLAAFADGRLFLSVNPTLTPPDTYNGPARPDVLEFSAREPGGQGRSLQPLWDGTPAFTEHSYRGMCADGPGRELLLFNVLAYEGYHWTFRDRTGAWSAHGYLKFPMGTEYEKPEPVRFCYPELALRARAAHVLAVSDIVEPVKAWRDFKLVINNGRTWDYDFRRLFYAWTPDITRKPFGTPVEVASLEKTAGQITNLDLWLDRRGRAHLLWLARSVWYPQMRDKFFPGTPLTTSLEYAIVNKGEVVRRATLAKGGEGASPTLPGYARFQADSRGQLRVFAYFAGRDDKGQPVSENRLLTLGPEGTVTGTVVVPLAHPFTSFMTATERGGTPPSDVLEVLGDAAGKPGIGYARIRVR